MHESNFKSKKIPGLKNESLRSKNALIFCAVVLLFCSILVWFVETIAQWAASLFSKYTKLPNKHEKNYEVIYSWESFNHIQLPSISSTAYIVAGGDVMLSRNIWFYAKNQWYDRIFKEWNYNPLIEFKDCKADNCLLFLNLESLFCEPDHDIQKGWFDFRANPKNIETLLQYRQGKPLLLALPNNHFINWWYQWLTITKELLGKNNIYSVWAGFSEDESREIFSWENNWIKFCLWAYSYDGTSAKVRWWVVYRNWINEGEIKDDLQKMKEMKCDTKIISLHRWAEYHFSPNTWQRNLAHNLIDSWADLILWWHSHIPWEFELYNWKYVFYSLWNFIFDQWWWKRATGSEFNYFYDVDLGRNTVPTYISMLIWLSFKKNIMWKVDINLEQIEFSSTTDGIFNTITQETRNNLLEKINKLNTIL